MGDSPVQTEDREPGWTLRSGKRLIATGPSTEEWLQLLAAEALEELTVSS